jgi:hypothetical protein
MTGIITDDDVDAQDRSTERTAQPTPLALAQERVQQAFDRLVGHKAGIDEMATAYESDYDKNLRVATAAELNQWAESLEQQRAARGAEQATQAAQRALGAQAVEEQMEGRPA